MNFIEDVLERFPASKRALVAVGADGERRDWHFGELIAMSAGLSGALAERGVHRGDVVMTLVGNRVEWVLTMLACWRMGAVPLPCNTQLRRHDLELRAAAAGPALCVGDDAALAELPDGVPYMTLAELAEAVDEDRPHAPAGSGGRPRPRGPGADRLHLGHHRRAAGRAARAALPAGPARAGRALARGTGRRAGLVHDRPRLVEVGPQRVRRPVAVRGGGDDRRRALRRPTSGWR